MICEPPSCYLVDEWIFPTFGLPNPQYCIEGEHQFWSFLRLRMNDCNQYYSVAVTTIYFYDYFLTLADEVSHVISVSPR